jgi:hypothetical protein
METRLTSVTGRVPVDRISERAHAARPGRTLLAAAAWLLLNAAFAAARLLSVLWLAVAWSAIALHEGWCEGRSQEWAAHVAGRKQQRARAGRAG